MGEERAQMVFTDPPYNVKIDGHVCGLGSVHHKPFEMAAGEMSESEFTRFLATSMALMTRYSVDGAIHDICMDWRHMGELLAAAEGIYSDQKNLCVWNKTNAAWGRSTAQSMSWYSCSRSARRPTSTTLVWAGAAVTAPTSGTMPASTLSKRGA